MLDEITFLAVLSPLHWSANVIRVCVVDSGVVIEFICSEHMTHDD